MTGLNQILNLTKISVYFFTLVLAQRLDLDCLTIFEIDKTEEQSLLQDLKEVKIFKGIGQISVELFSFAIR